MLKLKIKKWTGLSALLLTCSLTLQQTNAVSTDSEEVEEVTIIAVELFGQLAGAADFCEIALSSEWLGSLDHSFKEHSQDQQDYQDMQKRFESSRQDTQDQLQQMEQQIDCEQVQQAVDAEEPVQ